MAPYLVGAGRAARRSESEAVRNAQRDAELLLELVPCPRCRKRNPLPLRRFLRRAAVRCILPVPLTVASFAIALEYGITALGVAGLPLIAGALLWSLVGVGAHWTRWKGSKERVRLAVTCAHCDETVAIDLEGESCVVCRAFVHQASCAERHATEHGPTPYR